MLPERLLVGVKDAQYDDEVIGIDSKMNSEGEGVDGFNAHAMLSNRGGGGKMSNVFKIQIESICKLEPQAGRDAVIILDSFIDISNSVG